MTSEISRRGAAKAVAWSVPVITVAAAAPAVAASSQPEQRKFEVQPTLTYESQGSTTGIPFTFPTFGYSFYSTDYATTVKGESITNITYSIVLPVDDAHFVKAARNGADASYPGWTVPESYGGTSDLNGTPGYVYTFSFSGGPLAVGNGPADLDGNGPQYYYALPASADGVIPSVSVQNINADSKLMSNSPVQFFTTITAGGVVTRRQSDVVTIEQSGTSVGGIAFTVGENFA